MVVKNDAGQINIPKSMDSIQAEMKEIWGNNKFSIKVFFSEESKQREQFHDCKHCKYWNPNLEELEEEYEDPTPENSCMKRRVVDGLECIDPETAECRYWEYEEKA